LDICEGERERVRERAKTMGLSPCIHAYISIYLEASSAFLCNDKHVSEL
jgi:hypothetical protein